MAVGRGNNRASEPGSWEQHRMPYAAHVLLDDLIPMLFDKLLLSDKPDRSLIAWHG